MNRRVFSKLLGMSAASLALYPDVRAFGCLPGQKRSDLHEVQRLFSEGLKSLPREAKPWTYWMWLNSNITREGITADLEAMQRIGLGGMVIMNLEGWREGIPQGKVDFMTSAWRKMMYHAISEAARLGLQLDLNNDDGWNQGGPWITPELNMQKLTWSKTPVTGPGRFSGPLKQPPALLDTYSDVAVLAVPAPDVRQFPEAKKSAGEDPVYWIQLEYKQNITVRSLTISRKEGNTIPKHCELQVSDDGKIFRTVRGFETGWLSLIPGFCPSIATVNLPAVESRFFRVLMPDVTAKPGNIEFTPGAEPRIDLWRLKTGIDYIKEHGDCSPLYAMPDRFPDTDETFPDLKEVINLSGNMRADGYLEWQIPEGKWTILRIGHTPTGKRIHKAQSEKGAGLDSDRMNKKALETQLSGMVDKVIADAGPLTGKGLTMIHTDSYESGPANWTGSFPEEFRKRRGYDLIPWLAVMAGGRVIGSMEESERFLWDVRRTLADLIIDNDLKYFRSLCHQRGLLFTSESAGRQQFMYDPVSFQVCSDLPMGECWNIVQEQRPRPDCKAAASAAHITDLPFAGAEIFTQNRNDAGSWLETPFSLKSQGDAAFCFGINRYFFHRAILQPDPDKKPGLTWPDVGINFDTTNTWWDAAKSYMEYLARCQYLLQQGKFVADVAVLLEEGAPVSLIRELKNPVTPHSRWDPSTITEGILRTYDKMPLLPPQGYDYDYVNAHAVEQMRVEDGDLTFPHGMKYRILVLPPTVRITLPLMRKLRALAYAGATIVGMRPVGSPTLNEYGEGDKKVRVIAEELWGDDKKENSSMPHVVGKGKVFEGNATDQALRNLHCLPDFRYEAADAGNRGKLYLDYIHRRAENADIYFVSNQQSEAASVNCTFRIAGREPEIWLPDTGEVINCGAFNQSGEHTTIPLEFDPYGSLFIVFRKGKKTKKPGTAESNFPVLQHIKEINDGPWTVRFDPDRGGPEKIQMPRLESWSENQKPGIRYYSGTAVYENEFDISSQLLKSEKEFYIDLGDVKEIANIRLNGKDLGTLWKPPFRIKIIAPLREGKNKIEVAVTNLWVNRLIGDAGLPEKERLASINWNPYKPKDPLKESGLLGPVRLLAGH